MNRYFSHVAGCLKIRSIIPHVAPLRNAVRGLLPFPERFRAGNRSERKEKTGAIRGRKRILRSPALPSGRASRAPAVPRREGPAAAGSSSARATGQERADVRCTRRTDGRHVPFFAPGIPFRLFYGTKLRTTAKIPIFESCRCRDDPTATAQFFN